MKKLYIVRHGETNWNLKKILQGSADIELNDQGIAQAKKLVNDISIDDIDICVCSPLKRARETAKILVDNKIKIVYDDLLLERGVGDLEGKPIVFDEIVSQWDYKLNDSSNNIECIRDCLKRAKTFLDKVKKEYPQKNVLIVSHGGFIKALHFNLIGYDENTDFLSFNPENATLYEYDY